MGNWEPPKWRATAELAWQTYNSLATANEDPEVPSRPRRVWDVERRMWSCTPFHVIFNNVVSFYFHDAIAQGFEGNIHAWNREVQDVGSYLERQP